MAYSTAAAVGSGEEGGADFVTVLAAYAAVALQTSTAAWKNQWRG